MTISVDLNPDHLGTVKAILADHVPECEVRAFGSRATWTARDYSDLDLAVVGEGPLDWPTLSRLKEAFEESDLPMRVDVLDWHATSESFREVIERDYVVLWEEAKQPTAVHWTELTLGDVCTKIGSGATPRGGKEVYLEDGPYALIRSQNVYNAGFARDGLAFISDAHAEALHNVEVLPDDVLLNITGDSVARVCQVDRLVLPARVNQHVAIIRTDPDKLDSGYLRYYLAAPEVQSMLLSWAGSGGTRNALTKRMIETFVVQAPADLAEQRAIAHVLGTLDDKIELNRRMNETLEEMARALFKSWFVDFEPVRAKMEGRWRRGQSLPGLPAEYYDLFPDRLVNTELGEVPEGWEVRKLGEVVEVVGGTTPSTKVIEYWQGGTHCWTTPKDLSNLSTPVLLDTERKITDAGLQQIRSGLQPVGTLLLSSRAPIGYLAISEVPVAVNQGFISIPPGPVLPNLYLLYWCQAHEETIINYANGSTFLEISKSNFRQLLLIMPDMSTLNAYHKIASSLHGRIVTNERESRALAAQRDTLLPRLMGETLAILDGQVIGTVK